MNLLNDDNNKIIELNIDKDNRKNLRIKIAFEDIYKSIMLPNIWGPLGYREFRSQYQRTKIGPFWHTLHSIVWISAIIFIFTNVYDLDEEINYFVNYVSLGVVIFNTINYIVTESSDIYIRSRIIIHAFPNPLFLHILKTVTAGFFLFCFQFIAVAFFFTLYPIELNIEVFPLIIGTFLFFTMCIAIANILGIIGAQYGDFKFVILAVMRLMFFVTPIFWTLDQWAGAPLQIVTLNPITNFIDLLREPILGQTPDGYIYMKAIFWIIITVIAGGILFIRKRGTIAMWV